MLENSLKTREKFINKLKGKLDSMIESVSLLQKVDKKLLKVGVQNGGARLNNLKMAPMKGGAGKNYNFADVETAALRKKAQINLQKKKIEELADKLKNLSNDFEPVQTALENVKVLINSIKIGLPPLDIVLPNFSELPIVWQYNALHDVPLGQLSSFVPGIKLLKQSIVPFDEAPVPYMIDDTANVGKKIKNPSYLSITDDEKKLMLTYCTEFNETKFPKGYADDLLNFDKPDFVALYDLTRDDIHERIIQKFLMTKFPAGNSIYNKKIDDQIAEVKGKNYIELAEANDDLIKDGLIKAKEALATIGAVSAAAATSTSSGTSTPAAPKETAEQALLRLYPPGLDSSNPNQLPGKGKDLDQQIIDLVSTHGELVAYSNDELKAAIRSHKEYNQKYRFY